MLDLFARWDGVCVSILPTTNPPPIAVTTFSESGGYGIHKGTAASADFAHRLDNHFHASGIDHEHRLGDILGDPASGSSVRSPRRPARSRMPPWATCPCSQPRPRRGPPHRGG